eukprot:15348982-Ditylum_brightwellii.AAC.2
MAMMDAPSVCKKDQCVLLKQCAAKLCKEELFQEKQLNKVTEEFIDALYYHDMYNSAAFWKSTAQVDNELCKIHTMSARLHAIKENIWIHGIGFGWIQFATPWSKHGKLFTEEYLSNHLKNIIAAETTQDIPTKPPVPIPKWKNLPQLGCQATDVQKFNVAQLEKSHEFETKAQSVRLEREENGVGDQYSELQPTSMPEINDTLVGIRLDVC